CKARRNQPEGVNLSLDDNAFSVLRNGFPRVTESKQHLRLFKEGCLLRVDVLAPKRIGLVLACGKPNGRTDGIPNRDRDSIREKFPALRQKPRFFEQRIGEFLLAHHAGENARLLGSEAKLERPNEIEVDASAVQILESGVALDRVQ